jgi:uncharacterized membrane protein YhaH (DUF805 family)
LSLLFGYQGRAARKEFLVRQLGGVRVNLALLALSFLAPTDEFEGRRF